MAPRVLIVDDHPGMRRALRSLFTANRFEVCGEAVNGLDAIEKARKLSPNLILLDFRMPLMNGIEAARELSRIMPQVPLVMFTNLAGTIPEEEARRAGISSVMSKHGSYAGLIDHARTLLRPPDYNESVH